MIFAEDGQAVATFECAAVVEDKLYFAEISGSEIFCYDLENNKMSLLCTIAEEDEDGTHLFSSMIIYGKSLFLFPFFANHIYKISTETGSYNVIELPDKSMTDCKIAAKFIDAHLYKDIIWVMPAAYLGILKIDCLSDKVESYDEWIREIPCQMLEKDSAFFRKSLYRNDRIYAPSCKGNIVMIFDLRTGSSIVREVGSSVCHFSGICCDGQDFWISPRDNGPIVRWNEAADKWQEYATFPKGYVAASTTGIEAWKNRIFVFPQAANMIVTVDGTEGTTIEWNEKYRNNNVLWYQKTKDSLAFCLAKTAEVVILQKEKIRALKLLFPQKYQEWYSRKKTRTYRKLKYGMEKGDVLAESYLTALQDFCQYLLHTEKQEKAVDWQESIGQEIYRQIMQ